MHKYIICLVSCNLLAILFISSCDIKHAEPASQCNKDAPLFTLEIGIQAINRWGENLKYYSPNGSGGYRDRYVGAAYFVANQYLTDPVLLPTVSPITRLGINNIYDYFTSFFAHDPQMIMNSQNRKSYANPIVTLAGCGYGVISGYYNFNYSDKTPSTAARYTFEFNYLATPKKVTIEIESGTHAKSTVTVQQLPGWYIKLQNSAKLPPK